MSESAGIAERIKEAGIVAICRGAYPLESLLERAEALLEAGVQVLEVTLDSGNALEAIGALRRRLGERALIGAGTVRVADQANAAHGAGAQFIVSPNFDRAILARCRANGLHHLPGVLTPTEAQAAFAAGCRMLKLFPAELGGPAYLKALRAPLGDIEFVPTGGITADNLGEYARAGAAAVGVGSSLMAGPHQPIDDLAARARVMKAAWEKSRYG